MNALAKQLRESVLRAELKQLNERLRTAQAAPTRLRRYRLRHIQSDYNKLERVARKWGLIKPGELC